MIKINIVLSVGVLAFALSSISSQDRFETVNRIDNIVRTATDPCLKTASDDLALNEIEYIAEEEPFDLGFDTAPYLPEDFNAYEGMEPNLNEIKFIEEPQEIELDFNTADYLPMGFNAYEDMEFGIEDIAYLELEEEIDLGFDVNDYLPKGFQSIGQ